MLSRQASDLPIRHRGEQVQLASGLALLHDQLVALATHPLHLEEERDRHGLVEPTEERHIRHEVLIDPVSHTTAASSIQL
eukprot:COSAG05_NODE_1956_length_3789_cov_3.679404_2_plen_80_part_00